MLSVQNDSDLKGIDKPKRWLAATFPDDRAQESNATIKAAKRDGVTFDCLKKARGQLRMETKKLEWTWYMRRHQKASQPWVIAPNSDEQSEPETAEISDKETKGAEFEGVGTLGFGKTEIEVSS